MKKILFILFFICVTEFFIIVWQSGKIHAMEKFFDFQQETINRLQYGLPESNEKAQIGVEVR
jgi:hypothetical protein